MWTPVVTVTPPAEEPVTIAEVREQCRMGGDTSNDTSLERYRKAARAWVEGYTGTRLITQTVRFSGNDFGGLATRFPIGPAQTISSITYPDGAGGTVTIDGTIYENSPGNIYPAVFPALGQRWPSLIADARLTVTAIVGYGGPEAVPDDLKLVILLLAAAMNDNRGELPEGALVTARALCGPHKRWTV